LAASVVLAKLSAERTGVDTGVDIDIDIGVNIDIDIDVGIGTIRETGMILTAGLDELLGTGTSRRENLCVKLSSLFMKFPSYKMNSLSASKSSSTVSRFSLSAFRYYFCLI
jgi:hypothetical protein